MAKAKARPTAKAKTATRAKGDGNPMAAAPSKARPLPGRSADAPADAGPHRRAANAAGRAFRPPPPPPSRTMSVIAQDPSVRTMEGDEILMTTVSVPAERLAPGPRGYRVHVIDYDATTRRFLGAHRLPPSLAAEPAAWRRGDPSIVSDARFHAQNVYALVMMTLARFEFALGRRVGWQIRSHQLHVAPHGLVDANAFYSRDDQGLVLGSFVGRNGQAVHTCLSHDIVVHETAHALLDGLRGGYLVPSSPDQAAFHEAFGDVVALLSVLSQPKLVEKVLLSDPRDPSRRTLGSLDPDDVYAEPLRKSALLGLAEEMGQECQSATGGALRRSVDELYPSTRWLRDEEFEEPHRRGEVLVAAMMNALLDAWQRRVVGSPELGHRDGLGRGPDHRYSAQRVAEEGAAIADYLLTMLIRAIDYMPPVHLTFGDVLSAMVTADAEVRPDDTWILRRAGLLRSFAAYGITPSSKRADVPGMWETPPDGLSYARVHFDSMRSDPEEVFRFLWENRELLDLCEEAYTRVTSVRPSVRIGPDGFVLHETVVEYSQLARLSREELEAKGIRLPAGLAEALEARPATAAKGRGRAAGAAEDEPDDEGPDDDDADGAPTLLPIEGGGTLIFGEYGRLKYHVHNRVLSGKRQTRRIADLWRSGQIRIDRQGARFRPQSLAALHRARSLGGRRLPAEGW